MSDCLQEFEVEGPRYEVVLDAEVKEAEKAIRDGLDRFPNDPHLLASLSDFFTLLAKSDKALGALERAFKHKPQSVLVARRLAAAYEARNDIKAAREVLLACLEHNPGNFDLHYEIARNLLESQDFADNAEVRPVVLHHLTRSVQKGDKRYDRRFWYARELFLNGLASEARSIFHDLKHSPLPFHVKKELRGELKLSDGSDKRFTGRIDRVGPNYCFIQSDELSDTVYAAIGDFPESSVAEGRRVSFALTFSMFGPTALDIHLLF